MYNLHTYANSTARRTQSVKRQKKRLLFLCSHSMLARVYCFDCFPLHLDIFAFDYLQCCVSSVYIFVLIRSGDLGAVSFRRMWTIHISIFAVELEWQTVFRTLLEFSMNFYGFTYILPYHRQQFMRQHLNPSILIRSLRIRQGVNITRFIGSVYQTEPPECETNSIHTEPWPLRVVLIFALFCWISNEIPFSYHLAMNSCCMLRSWFAIEIF